MVTVIVIITAALSRGDGAETPRAPWLASCAAVTTSSTSIHARQTTLL